MKELFLNNHLFTVEQFYNYVKGFEYAWMNQDGHKNYGINSADEYCLQTPSECFKNKYGICWDITELCRAFFETMTSLKLETYYLFYDDGIGCPSHSILIFYQDEKVYWFEPYFNGIFEYHSLNSLLQDFKHKFIEHGLVNHYFSNHYDISKFHCYQYEKPNDHINGHQMRKHIDHSIRIDV